MTVEASAYTALREKVDAIHEPDLPICKKGMGFCCTTNVPLIPEDQEVIIDGIKTRRILPQVVQHAIEKASDTSSNTCPFLGKDRECTIYEQRPLLCRVWGRAGFPRKEALPVFQKNLATLKEKGIDTQMEQRDLAICACSFCAIPLILENPTYYTSTLRTIAETHVLYQKPSAQRTPMTEFVLKRLRG
jgi:Fe-S-cluster containining protein